MKEREEFLDDGQVRKRMSDIHCFELSEVYQLIYNRLGSTSEALPNRLRAHYETNGAFAGEALAFLPAPRTWLEWKPAGYAGRVGFLLEADSADPQHLARVSEVHCYGEDRGIASEFRGHLELRTKNLTRQLRRLTTTTPEESNWITDDHILVQFQLYAALALINSPRVIGRKQHMPHRGLEKSLTKGLGIGKFPLKAWTEIRLHVNRLVECPEQAYEAHLTGRRALHFCREHLRIRLGALEYVTAHWRGDPALGIKQSRYVVTQ
jgi:hypothetical protein